MQLSIEYQGILALFINPNSETAKALEDKFSMQNTDGYVRIHQKGEPLYKVTLVSQHRFKEKIESIAARTEEMTGQKCSKKQARAILKEEVKRKLCHFNKGFSQLSFGSLEKRSDLDKDGNERKSLVAFIEDQKAMDLLVVVMCGILGIDPDDDRNFHLSAYNLTGNPSDSPSLM